MGSCNYHTHSNWCDGRDTPEAMALAAIEKGFDTLGFSSHAMIPAHEIAWTLSAATIRDYVASIRELAKSLAPRIRILCGVEADYVEGGSTPDRSAFTFTSSLDLHLDYIIGSVHNVRAEDGAVVFVDKTPQALAEGIRDHFGGSVERFVRAYFKQERDMIARFDFDVVGHPDLVRKFMIDSSSEESKSKKGALQPLNYNSDLQLQEWYLEELRLTADAIAKSGKKTEVNTGAISRGWLDDAYPSADFRALLRERGVKFILSSDAHAADALDCAFDRFAAAEDYVRLG